MDKINSKTKGKYLKLLDFIASIKTDKEMSKYLYYETSNIKYLNEYNYNYDLELCIMETLKRTPLLKKLFDNYMKDNFSILDNIQKNNELARTYYRKLEKEYTKFTNAIFSIEDVLYEKNITKGVTLDEFV